ncbi:putative reverse transcriptase domain-containing protein [Tanacetum coccineum]
MRQRRWIELFSDYECEIRYHPGKANAVANALSRKEWVKPKCVREMAMTIQSGVKGMILVAQGEAFNQENIFAERLHRLDQQMERKGDESLYFMDRTWVPLVGGVRTTIMDEAHKSMYSVHPKADKMYYDFKDVWWLGIEEWILLTFVSRMLTCAKKALGTQLDMSTVYHSQTDGQSEHTIQTLEDMLRACVIDFGGSWGCPPMEGSLIRPELVQETTDKVVVIKEKLKAVRDRQKSYADNMRKPLEFEVGDRVMLTVSLWKGVVHFVKKGKLSLRYVGPFEILKRIGPVAYRLRLHEILIGVHEPFMCKI